MAYCIALLHTLAVQVLAVVTMRSIILCVNRVVWWSLKLKAIIFPETLQTSTKQHGITSQTTVLFNTNAF
jgi:hypothetical protein